MNDELSLNEAAELIQNLNEPEPAEEVDTAPETSEILDIPDAPEQQPDYITEAQGLQPKLAAYQMELNNEALAIREAEKEAKAYRQNDPGEYSARLAEIMQRQQRLDQATQQYHAYVNNIETKVSEQYNREYERKRSSENAKLQRDLGWNQEKKSELTKYLKGKGYTNQQLSQIQDAETVKLAWKAMQADKQTKKTLPRKKKVNHMAQAEAEIQRNKYRDSTLAGAKRIEALMKDGRMS